MAKGEWASVYIAEQPRPMRRLVALKIVKPGMDSRQVIARFEAERQALALMDHPNIAKVLDAGTTKDGRPYFVMELVDPDQDFGIVSDIDDTVMVTALPRPLLAAWHTFVVNEHARTTTPGHAGALRAADQRAPGRPGGLPVHRRLERRAHPDPVPVPQPLPGRSAAADRLGPDRGSLVPQRPASTSAPAWHRLAREFPEITWLLIGDDGQHDEEIYTELRRASIPTRSRAVCIRQLTPGEAVLAGSSLRDLIERPTTLVPWLYAPDGAGLADELERIGLLQTRPPSARGHELKQRCSTFGEPRNPDGVA